MTYTGKYTLRNVHLYAPAGHRALIGVSIAKRTRDMAFIDSDVTGYLHPVVTGGSVKREPDLTDAVFVNFLVDGEPINVLRDIHSLISRAKATTIPISESHAPG